MLKLSGEALMGNQDFGIDLNTINAITDQIIYVFKKGIKVLNKLMYNQVLKKIHLDLKCLTEEKDIYKKLK